MKATPPYASSWQYSHIGGYYMGVPCGPQNPVYRVPARTTPDLNFQQNDENKRPARIIPTKVTKSVPQNDENKRQARTNPTKVTKSVPQNNENKRQVRNKATKTTKSSKAMRNAELWTDVFNKNLSDVFTRNLDRFSRDLIRDYPLQVDWSVTADFVCENRLRGEKVVCGRSWDSTQVTVTFLYKIELDRNRGVIHIKEYGQRCQKCNSPNIFAAPTIDYESADRAAMKLKQKILEKFYGKDPQEFPDSSHDRRERKKPHDKANCEACMKGVCTASKGRKDGGPRWIPESYEAVVSHGRKIGQWVLKINDSHEEIKIGKKPKSNRQKTKKGGGVSKQISTSGKLSAQNNQLNQTTSKKSATKPSTSKASTATTKPGSETVKPASATAKPGSGTAKPGTAHIKPNSGTTKPGSADTKPCTPTAKPGSAAIKLKTPTAKPGSVAAKPSSVARKPGSVTPKRGSVTPKPGSVAAKPGSATVKHGSATVKHGSAAAKHGSVAVKHGSAITKPGSATTKPKQNTDTSSKSSKMNAITNETTIGKQERGTEHKIKKNEEK